MLPRDNKKESINRMISSRSRKLAESERTKSFPHDLDFQVEAVTDGEVERTVEAVGVQCQSHSDFPLTSL